MAFQAKNRCPQCAACPICETTLTVTSRESEFILTCEFCKWSSEEIELSGSSAAQLFEKIRDREDHSEAAAEFERLINHYGSSQLNEDEKEALAEDTNKRDYHDVQAAITKIEANMEDKRSGLYRLPKEPVDNATEAGVESSTTECTISQRLENTGLSVAPEQLWPRLVPLRTKNGRRAPDGRFVIKPKAGANKTSFDIQNLAMAVLPRTTLGLVSDLKKDEATRIMIYFKNPVDVPVKLSFSDVDTALIQAEEDEMKQKIQDEEEGVMDDEEEDSGGPQLVAVPSQWTAEAKMPESVTLKAFDDIAEQNDIFATAESKTDPNDDAHVGFRNLSKAGVFFDVTPLVDSGDVNFSFVVNVEPDLPADSTKTAEDLPFMKFSYQLVVTLGTLAQS